MLFNRRSPGKYTAISSDCERKRASNAKPSEERPH
jgi:hypothetical protein